MVYVAKSPLVIVRNGAGQDVFVYRDNPIPVDALPETVKQLLAEGHIGNDVAPVDVVDGPVRPNEAGPGSAKDKWIEYAEAVDVWVEDDASKDDIIAAVKSAGL